MKSPAKRHMRAVFAGPPLKGLVPSLTCKLTTAAAGEALLSNGTTSCCCDTAPAKTALTCKMSSRFWLCVATLFRLCFLLMHNFLLALWVPA